MQNVGDARIAGAEISARARLGREVALEFDAGTSLTSIAAKLGVTDEQVRRYRQAYRDWLRDHTDAQLDD